MSNCNLLLAEEVLSQYLRVDKLLVELSSATVQLHCQ